MSVTIETSPVHFTPSARAEVIRLMAERQSGDTMLLRVGVKGGGCSGLSYVMAFDQKKDADIQYDADGVVFIMDPAHGLYLQGMEIHWEGGLNARGFTFTNPNASSTCGCGSSFAV